MPVNNLRQADVPEGARYDHAGPRLRARLVAELAGRQRVYAVPGVPAEMVEMMEGTILPELAALAGPASLVSRTLRCAGIGESRVAELLRRPVRGLDEPQRGLPRVRGEVKVRLTAKAPSPEEADALIDPLADEVRARLGDVVFTTDDETLEEAVGRLLRERAERSRARSRSPAAASGRGSPPSRGRRRASSGPRSCTRPRRSSACSACRRETIDGPGS